MKNYTFKFIWTDDTEGEKIVEAYNLSEALFALKTSYKQIVCIRVYWLGEWIAC